MLTIAVYAQRYPLSRYTKKAFGNRFLQSESNGDGKKQRFKGYSDRGPFPRSGIRVPVRCICAATYRW